MIALMAMTFFLLTGVSTTTSSLKVSGSYRQTVGVFNIAEAGIARARTFIEAQSSFSNVLSTYASIPITTGSLNGGTYDVRVKNNSDGGGATTDKDNIIIVTSTGTGSDGTKAEIETYLQKLSTVNFPPNPTSGGSNMRGTAALMCGTSTDIKM